MKKKLGYLAILSIILKTSVLFAENESNMYISMQKVENDNKAISSLFAAEEIKKKLSGSNYLKGQIYKKTFPLIQKEIYLRKYIRIPDGMAIQVVVNNRGQEDYQEVLISQEISAYNEKYGALSKELAEEIEKGGGSDKIQTVLWIEDKDFKFPVKKLFNDPFQLSEFDTLQKNISMEFNDRKMNIVEKVLSELQEIDPSNKIIDTKFAALKREKRIFNPTFAATLSKKQIRHLKYYAPIKSVEIDHSKKIVCDLADAAVVMNVDDLNDQGWNGSGINVGILHHGSPNFLSQVGSPIYWNQGLPEDQHLTWMITSVRNSRTYPERGRGFAYDANIYVGNYYNGTTQGMIDAAIDWLLSKMCRVINQSWHFEGEDTNGDMNYHDRRCDWVTTHYPYPIFSQAGGNIGRVVHKGFNQLVVGQDLQTTEVAGSWVNPNSGQELPHITAGVDYSMSMFDNPNGTPSITSHAGTSVAAALMNGFIADLQECNSNLASWPEAKRAIIMASGDNIVDGTWQNDQYIDGKDGAGRANGRNALYMAQNRLSNPSSLGGSFGWYASTGFGAPANDVVIRINVSTQTRLNIVLSWSAQITGNNYSTVQLADLDLYLYTDDGHLVSGSTQIPDPIEAINLSSINPGIYKIIIRPYSLPNTVTFWSVAWCNR